MSFFWLGSLVGESPGSDGHFWLVWGSSLFCSVWPGTPASSFVWLFLSLGAVVFCYSHYFFVGINKVGVPHICCDPLSNQCIRRVRNNYKCEYQCEYINTFHEYITPCSPITLKNTNTATFCCKYAAHHKVWTVLIIAAVTSLFMWWRLFWSIQCYNFHCLICDSWKQSKEWNLNWQMKVEKQVSLEKLFVEETLETVAALITLLSSLRCLFWWWLNGTLDQLQTSPVINLKAIAHVHHLLNRFYLTHWPVKFELNGSVHYDCMYKYAPVLFFCAKA